MASQMVFIVGIPAEEPVGTIVKAFRNQYKSVYSAEYGAFGGRPFGAIIANYEFGPGPQDIMLLQKGLMVMKVQSEGAAPLTSSELTVKLANGTSTKVFVAFSPDIGQG